MAKTPTINVEFIQDGETPTVRAKTKADEKRMRQALTKLKGKQVGVLVEGNEAQPTIRFLDLAMAKDPVLSSALYGGLGAVVGSIPGALMASPVMMWLGWTAGGAAGARAGATQDRKSRGTWGGGIGGALGGPVGAALGGALGSRKADKKTKMLKNKLLK